MSGTVTISRALANKIVYVLDCKKSFTQGGSIHEDKEVVRTLDALRAEIKSKHTLLTDKEMEAISLAMLRCDRPHYATLRNLLERLK